MVANKAKRYYEQLDREIEKSVASFSEHLMSNSKWVKLIDQLVNSCDRIKKIQFKKIQSDQLGELFIEEDTTFGFDYWQNGFEGHNSLGGWLKFKEIEFLIFPRDISDMTNEQQDLTEILRVIQGVGQFALDIDEQRIKLICYR